MFLSSGWRVGDGSGERTRPRRVLACNFRRLAGKDLFGETPNTTREDAYAPQTFPSISASRVSQVAGDVVTQSV